MPRSRVFLRPLRVMSCHMAGTQYILRRIHASRSIYDPLWGESFHQARIFSNNPKNRCKVRSASTVAMRHGPREKIHLTGPEELLLGTLFMRAEDAKYSNPVLGDQYAQGLIERCNINTGESHYPTDPRWVRAIACRAKQLDDWCQVSHKPTKVSPTERIGETKGRAENFYI